MWHFWKLRVPECTLNECPLNKTYCNWNNDLVLFRPIALTKIQEELLANIKTASLMNQFSPKKKLTLTIFIIFLSLSVCICFDVSKKYSKPLTLLFLQRRDTFWTDFLPKDCTYEVLIHLCWYQQNSWAKEVLKNSNSSNSAEPLAHLFHVSNNFTSCSSFGKVS